MALLGKFSQKDGYLDHTGKDFSHYSYIYIFLVSPHFGYSSYTCVKLLEIVPQLTDAVFIIFNSFILSVFYFR